MDGTFKIDYKEHAYSKSYLFRYSIILMSIIDGAHYTHTYTYPFILSLLAQLLSAFSSIFWVIFSVKDPKQYSMQISRNYFIKKIDRSDVNNCLIEYLS